MTEQEFDDILACDDTDDLDESLRNKIYQLQLEQYQMQECQEYLEHFKWTKNYHRSLKCKDEHCKWKINTVPFSSLSQRQAVHVMFYHADDYNQMCERRNKRFWYEFRLSPIRDDSIHDLENKEEMSEATQSEQKEIEWQPGQKCNKGDGCEILLKLLELCKTTKPTSTILADADIDHCLESHVDWKSNKMCPCNWKKTAQGDGISRLLQLHGHFYHDEVIDEDEKREEHVQTSRRRVNEEEEEKAIVEYKMADTEYKRDDVSVLEFGYPFIVLAQSEAVWKNPKDEILNNKFKTLTKKEWNDLLKKCVVYSKSVHAKVSSLSVKEVVALKLYTDFDSLQHQFRLCFRETDEQKRIDRQRHFWHWNDLLEKTCRKSQDIITEKLYHGINNDQLAASSFSGTYYGPVSTTTEIAVAKAFSGKNGQIFELYPSFGARGLRVAWLSNFPDETEILYMNVSFQISDIIKVQSLQDLGALPSSPTASRASLNMEQCILNALRSINTNSKIISLNEDDEHADQSHFDRLQIAEKVAVLYLLYIQYRPKEWNDLITSSDLNHLANAFMKFRGQFISLAERVEAVSMDNMSKPLQLFFYSKSAEFKLPILDNSINLEQLLQAMEEKFVPQQPFYISRIVKLFPAVQQIAISADNFDWTLNRFVDFLDSYHFEFDQIALQDIYIRRIEPEQAKQRLMTNEVSEQMHILQKYGWRLASSVHLHRTGLQPVPENPFLHTFIDYEDDELAEDDEEKDDEKNDDSVSLRPLLRTYTAKIMSPETSLITSGGDEFEEGINYVFLDHNPSNCTLTEQVFRRIKYKLKLVELLKWRKTNCEGSGIATSSMSEKDRLGARFVSGCENVESLVLGPLPSELYGIFYTTDGKEAKSKQILSFHTITCMFPNVTDLFLRSTRFTPRECNIFIAFVQKLKSRVPLKRIFYSTAHPIYERDVSKVKLRLKEIGCNFVRSQQMISIAPNSTT